MQRALGPGNARVMMWCDVTSGKAGETWTCRRADHVHDAIQIQLQVLFYIYIYILYLYSCSRWIVCIITCMRVELLRASSYGEVKQGSDEVFFCSAMWRRGVGETCCDSQHISLSVSTLIVIKYQKTGVLLLSDFGSRAPADWRTWLMTSLSSIVFYISSSSSVCEVVCVCLSCYFVCFSHYRLKLIFFFLKEQ